MNVEKYTCVGNRVEYTSRADFGTVFAGSEDAETLLAVDMAASVGLDPIGPVSRPAAF